MNIKLYYIINKNKLGISFRKIQNFTSENLENFIDYINIELENTKSNLKINKSSIQEFTYNRDKREFYFSVLLKRKKIIRELYYLEDELVKNEITGFTTRNIEVVIQLKKSLCIIFSKSKRDVEGFSNFIRKISLNNFYPSPLSFSSDGFKKIIKQIKNVRSLKLSIQESNKMVDIHFRGINLLEKDFIKNILNEQKFKILEIDGDLLYKGLNLKVNFKKKGRIIITSNPELFTPDFITTIIDQIHFLFED